MDFGREIKNGAVSNGYCDDNHDSADEHCMRKEFRKFVPIEG